MSGAPRVLMLVAYETVQGPLPKISPLLIGSLRKLGCVIETEHWSRHKDEETLREKVKGRVADLRSVLVRLRRQRFDVLFITTAHTPAGLARDIPLVLLSRRLCPHRVVVFHGSMSDILIRPGHLLLKLASRLLVANCDAALVLSEQEKREWEEFAPRGRFVVVANPYEPELPEPEADASKAVAAAGRTRWKGEVPALLYVGRLIPEKGVLDVVGATALLSVTTPCRLTIAGDGPAAAVAADEVARLGIGDRVRSLGYAAGADLRRAYQEADVLVLPTYWAEGFPTVILEAMSMGLPIVTTRLRGAADRLEEGVNALFVPPRHPVELARALQRLLDDDLLRTEMGASNLAKVREFAPDLVAPAYMDVIRSVTANGSGVPRKERPCGP